MQEEKKSLYRKYRPQTFEELSGQKQVVEILKNAAKMDKISHAYLFAGPRGTGKTSVAKIISKLFNCENHQTGEVCNQCISCQTKENDDILELDAASNNGVDEIRNIISKVNFSPNYGKYKIYIIDEVHMLSIGAFNALLKTLEEPPAHVIFILATTELHKIPKTILSRCQRYDFKKITPSQMQERLREISNKENIQITDEALIEIAQTSDGAMRDAISMLDQISTYKEEEITKDDVTLITGGVAKSKIEYFLGNVLLGNIETVINEIDEYDQTNKNYIKICDDIIKYFKDEIIKKYQKHKNIIEDKNISEKTIFKLINILQDGMLKIKNSNSNKLTFELIIFEIISIVNNKAEKEIKEIKEIKEKLPIDNVSVVEEKKEMVDEPLLIKPLKEKVEKEVKEEKLDSMIPKENKVIRVNNCLVKANKDLKMKLIQSLNEQLIVGVNSNLLNIVKSANVMVVSDDIIIFTTPYQSGAEMINEKYFDIEKMLKEILKIEFKIVALDESEWKFILEDYKINKQNYVLKEEPLIKQNQRVKTELEEILGTDLVKVN